MARIGEVQVPEVLQFADGLEPHIGACQNAVIPVPSEFGVHIEVVPPEEPRCIVLTIDNLEVAAMIMRLAEVAEVTDGEVGGKSYRRVRETSVLR